MIKSYWQKGKKQKRIVVIGGIILVLLLFFLRDDYQPALLFLRKYREEIYNKIWGTDIIVGDRTLDVHIRKLREKIGSEFVKTSKGIGYAFIPSE
mgnify:CR=1 FL=1